MKPLDAIEKIVEDYVTACLQVGRSNEAMAWKTAFGAFVLELEGRGQRQ